MECTESSRWMRGAQKVFYEYILELHDRMNERSRYFILVGDDGGMHVIAGEYYRQAIVLGEISSVSCL